MLPAATRVAGSVTAQCSAMHAHDLINASSTAPPYVVAPVPGCLLCVALRADGYWGSASLLSAIFHEAPTESTVVVDVGA